MSIWLLAKALSPLLALLLVAAIARPASRWAERHLPAGRLKRLLFIHSERDKVAYAVGWVLVVVTVLVIGFFIGRP